MRWPPNSPFDTPLLESPLLRSRLGCVALTLLLCFGIFLRVNNLQIPTGRSPDETNYTAQAQRLLREGSAGLRGIAEEYQRDPAARLAGPPTRAGYLWALAATMRLTGRTDETAGAMLSCAASIGTMLLVALIGIRFFPPWATAFALLFLAIYPAELELARRAWSDALVGLLGLAVAYCAMEITRDSARRFWHAAFLIVGSVGIVVKEFGAVTFALCALWVVGLLIVRRQWRDAGFVIIGGLAGASLSLLYLVQAVGGLDALIAIVADWRGAHVANQYAIEFQSGPPWLLFRALYALSAHTILFSAYGMLIALGSILPRSSRKRNAPAQEGESRPPYRILPEVAWLALFCLALLTIPLLLTNWLNLRYVSAVFGPLQLLAALPFGAAIPEIWQRTGWQRWVPGIFLTLLLVLGFRGTNPKFRRFFVNDGVGDLSVKLILDRADMFATERLVKQRPTAENFLTLCWRYEQNWRYKDSIAACENALKMRPNFAAAYDQLAVAHVETENWPEAIAAARRALELDPTLPRAKFNLERAQRELAGPGN